MWSSTSAPVGVRAGAGWGVIAETCKCTMVGDSATSRPKREGASLWLPPASAGAGKTRVAEELLVEAKGRGELDGTRVAVFLAPSIPLVQQVGGWTIASICVALRCKPVGGPEPVRIGRQSGRQWKQCQWCKLVCAGCVQDGRVGPSTQWPVPCPSTGHACASGWHRVSCTCVQLVHTAVLPVQSASTAVNP